MSFTFSALTTITKSPVSTCGVKLARCLPRRTVATRVASRPSTRSLASTRHQRAGMSSRLKLRVVLWAMAPRDIGTP